MLAQALLLAAAVQDLVAVLLDREEEYVLCHLHLMSRIQAVHLPMCAKPSRAEIQENGSQIAKSILKRII